MCAHCGCQSVSVIDDLTREHDAVITLVDQACEALAAGHGETASRTCQAILAVLAPHAAVEGVIFPVLARENPGHVDVIHGEHRQMRRALDRAADSWDASSVVELPAALAMLRLHIRKEEDGLFPMALATLTHAEWDAVCAMRSRVGNAADFAGTSAAP